MGRNGGCSWWLVEVGVIRLRNGGSDYGDQPYRIWQDAPIVLAEEAISATPGGNKSPRTRRRGKTDAEHDPRPNHPSRAHRVSRRTERPVRDHRRGGFSLWAGTPAASRVNLGASTGKDRLVVDGACLSECRTLGVSSGERGHGVLCGSESECTV
ncbi:hypothetical protein GY45DRAFT_1319899 [Cubamyces sp. BRFM 1775]|nr:hypothetical protein GY45DRAFT_1319899 [Cubamyces sp. BRFM 1775]